MILRLYVLEKRKLCRDHYADHFCSAQDTNDVRLGFVRVHLCALWDGMPGFVECFQHFFMGRREGSSEMGAPSVTPYVMKQVRFTQVAHALSLLLWHALSYWSEGGSVVVNLNKDL